MGRGLEVNVQCRWWSSLSPVWIPTHASNHLVIADQPWLIRPIYCRHLVFHLSLFLLWFFFYAAQCTLSTSSSRFFTPLFALPSFSFFSPFAFHHSVNPIVRNHKSVLGHLFSFSFLRVVQKGYLFTLGWVLIFLPLSLAPFCLFSPSFSSILLLSSFFRHVLHALSSIYLFPCALFKMSFPCCLVPLGESSWLLPS